MTYRTMFSLRISVLTALLTGLVVAQTAQEQSPVVAIAVTGDVATPLSLKAEDLAKMLRETVSVTEEDGSRVTYEGVLLREILTQAGVPSGTKLRGKALSSYVLAKAHDGYQVVFALGELDPSFGNAQILVADTRDGKSLFGYQGPFRLVCPNDKAGARSVRMLETIEVVRIQQ